MGKYTRRKSFFRASLLLVAFGLIQCENKQHDSRLDFLLALSLLLNMGDYYAQLYKVHPLIANDPQNTFYVKTASNSDIDPAKLNLILIHGWNVYDRDTNPYPTQTQLKERILKDYWSVFFNTSEFKTILAMGYDIYVFDYLTSNGIDSNGHRLRASLDAVFGASSNSVVIFAHSMGGLISRQAVYLNDRPAYLKKIITSGTPFHGSPWASPAYLKDRSVLGDIVGFITDTSGGRDLAWDNFDNSIPGAYNTKLDALNTFHDRDDVFVAYYASQNNTSISPDAGASGLLNAACALLGPSFDPSDCIVPKSSASLEGHSLHCLRDIGNYDHLDINLKVQANRSVLAIDLSSLKNNTAFTGCI